MNIIIGFWFINMVAIIQSLLIEAKEKIFYLITSCKFYPLLNFLLKQEKKILFINKLLILPFTKSSNETAETFAIDFFKFLFFI